MLTCSARGHHRIGKKQITRHQSCRRNLIAKCFDPLIIGWTGCIKLKVRHATLMQHQKCQFMQQAECPPWVSVFAVNYNKWQFFCPKSETRSFVLFKS